MKERDYNKIYKSELTGEKIPRNWMWSESQRIAWYYYESAYHPDADLEQIDAIYQDARNMDMYCHVDHIIPLSHGGFHHQDNLQIILPENNMEKTDRILYKIFDPEWAIKDFRDVPVHLHSEKFKQYLPTCISYELKKQQAIEDKKDHIKISNMFDERVNKFNDAKKLCDLFYQLAFHSTKRTNAIRWNCKKLMFTYFKRQYSKLSKHERNKDQYKFMFNYAAEAEPVKYELNEKYIEFLNNKISEYIKQNY